MKNSKKIYPVILLILSLFFYECFRPDDPVINFMADRNCNQLLVNCNEGRPQRFFEELWYCDCICPPGPHHCGSGETYDHDICKCVPHESLAKNSNLDLANHAFISFSNQSNSSQSYDIILDGEWITTIAPDGESGWIEFPPGKHQIIFRNNITGETMCMADEVYLKQGKKTLFSCDQ